MGRRNGAALALGLAAAGALSLSGCGGERVASAPPPQATAREAYAAPSEAVWHLRAGLNVAALSCRGRGRAAVAPAYSRLLSRHRALLAAAYAEEERRYGSGFDRHQTKLYNRFAYQRSPERFCRDAAQVAGSASAMDSPSLARAAPGLLSRIGG